jgi:hypothetical protein
VINPVNPGTPLLEKGFGAAFARLKIRIIATIPRPIKENIYFSDILPIKINTILVTNKIAAVEKFAGSISVQIRMAGMITGKKPDLKFLILFLLFT